MNHCKINNVARRRLEVYLQSVAALFVLCLLGTAATFAAASAVSLASINRTGAASGNGASLGARLSASGRFLVFSSGADNLTANDTNTNVDVFFRDMLTGTTLLVSVDSTGAGNANGDSFDAIISANGQQVVFTSFASNLVPNDTNNLPDLFVRDLATATTSLVSLNRDGTASGNDVTFNSVAPSITPDGRFVAFHSKAADLAANDDNNNASDLFVRDLVAGVTTLVSVNRSGTASGINLLASPALSDDGRYVAFNSNASDLVANDNNGFTDVFLRDFESRTTVMVSVNRAGAASGSSVSRFPNMSADGRFIAFQSAAADLVVNDANSFYDVYVRDMRVGITSLVSVNPNGGTGSDSGNVTGTPRLTADGRFVAFSSSASDLVANDTNRRTDVFVRDLQTNTTSLVSRNSAGTNGGNGDSLNPLISSDGRFVSFESLANDLVGAISDTNGKPDIFLRDLPAGATTLLSVNSTTGLTSGNNGSVAATMSLDGRFVAFDSDASDLVGNDTNNLPDVFVRSGLSLTAPMLLTEGNTERAIALDSVTLMRDPFEVATRRNFSSDQRTRVMLFAAHVEFAPGDNASIVTAQAEDAQHRIFPLKVEFAGGVPKLYWLTQIVVALSDQLENAGDVRISINLHGVTSNKALISIKPFGSISP